jgi:serine/threonine protein kinase, bacterial
VANQLLSDRYQIIRTLGSGGFGETFLAEDTHMPSRRRCVVKRLRPVQDNPQINQLVQERFQREAAILEQLGNDQDQIPELYAYFYGQADQQFYLVQEWIDGDTLGAIAHQQGRLSEAEVRRILITLLPVFDYVHRKAIIHRDVKPDNIIVRRLDQQPVLIDFGAVRETMGTALNSQGRPTQSIIIGTPGYMASEQSVGRPVYSSDLYSLGLTAVYLLTGKQPQEFATNPSTSDILWRSDAPQISSELAHILDKAIASHPRDRYQTAPEFLLALQGAAPEAKTWVVPGGAPPVGTSSSLAPRSRLMLIGGAATGIAIGSGAIAALLFHPPQPAVTTVTVTRQSTPSVIAPSSLSSAVVPSTSTGANLPDAVPTTIPSSSNSTVLPPSISSSECSYFTGNAIEGQAVNLDLCSVQARNVENVSFVYSLGNRRLESVANCATGTWTTFTDQKVHRPLSFATQKMIDRVCHHQQSPVSKPTTTSPPTASVSEYYQDINNHDYPKAWQQLPIDMQSNTTVHPRGYDSFVQWWNSVATVETVAVQTVEQTAQQAQVQVRAIYHMKSGSVQAFALRYILRWDAVTQKWLIEKIKRS